MTKVTVKVEGLKELEKNLKQFSKGVGRNILKRALAGAAKPIRDAAVRLAPVDTGELRDSIGISDKVINNVGKAEYAAIMRAGGTKDEALAALRSARRSAKAAKSTVEIYVGTAVPYSIPVEFGTAHSAARPFLRPAWDENKDLALANIKDELSIEIGKAAARAELKAARAAAKAKA